MTTTETSGERLEESGEAAAWRIKTDSGWALCDIKATAWNYIADGHEVIPLYLHPSPDTGKSQACISETIKSDTQAGLPIVDEPQGTWAEGGKEWTAVAEVVITDEMIVSVATLYGNFIPGHGWTGFGPRPDQIRAALGNAS